jgi:hypothetical protein
MADAGLHYLHVDGPGQALARAFSLVEVIGEVAIVGHGTLLALPEPA